MHVQKKAEMRNGLPRKQICVEKMSPLQGFLFDCTCYQTFVPGTNKNM